MVRLLFAAIAFLAISSGSASSLDWENANDEETVKKVDAVKVENVKSVEARSLATQFTKAPTRNVGPPTPRTASPTRKPSIRGSLAPGASGPINICIIPSKKVYNCGEPISALFNYAYRAPRYHPTFKDRIAIYPCYVNTYTRHAEVWQWGCGAPPANPDSCLLPRSRGTVVFDKVPGYNGPKSDWPIAPNKRKSNGKTNTCFKIVILRTDNSPYSSYCEAKFTVKANSKAGCSVRNSSPSDP